MDREQEENTKIIPARTEVIVELPVEEMKLTQALISQQKFQKDLEIPPSTVTIENSHIITYLCYSYSN